MGLLGDVLTGGIQAKGMNDAQKNIEKIGNEAKTDLGKIGAQAQTDTAWNPYAVVTNTGNVTTGPNGGYVAALGADQKATSDAAMGAANGMFAAAGQSVGDRTNDIFAGAQAALQPGFQRADQQMANDLYSTGRTGFGGGSSEQYANKSAQEDSLLQAFFGARSQAGQEQLQQTQAADIALRGSHVSEASLINSMNPAIQNSNLNQTGQIAGANLNTQANMTGQEMYMNANIASGDLEAGMFGAAASAVGSVADTALSYLF
jgi:hypothetical protein